MSSTPGIKLSGLTEREAISDAIYRAVYAYDTNDTAFLESALTRDAVFQIGDQPEIRGLDVILKDSHSRIGPMNTGHLIGNLRIEVSEDGRSANVGASAISNHFKAGQGFVQGSEYFFVFALYDIAAVKEGDLWKVSSWKLNPTYTMGNPAVMAP